MRKIDYVTSRKHEKASKAYNMLCEMVEKGWFSPEGRRLNFSANELMIEDGDSVQLLPIEERESNGRYGINVAQVYEKYDPDFGWYYETGVDTTYWLGRKRNGEYKKWY